MFRSSILLLFGIFILMSCFAQSQTAIVPDLNKLLQENKITVINREASNLNDEKYKNGIHLNAKDNDGLALINNIKFENGIIEFDVKGKDVMQESFVGIAFYGASDGSTDVVYFRPFNFHSQDTLRRGHSVQYVSLPQYDWQKLRTDFPNKYEHSINNAPDPNNWFHVRVVIKSPSISVYVNNNSNPDLIVEQLGNRKKGMVGFWVGNGSDGDFANLKVTLQ